MTRNRIPVGREIARRRAFMIAAVVYIFAVIMILGAQIQPAYGGELPVVSDTSGHWHGAIVVNSAAGGRFTLPADVICGPCGIDETLPANGTRLFTDPGSAILTRSAFGTVPAPDGDFGIEWLLTYDGDVHQSYSGPPIGSVVLYTTGYVDRVESTESRKFTLTFFPREESGAVVRVSLFDGNNQALGTEECLANWPVSQCQIQTVIPGGAGRAELDVLQGGTEQTIPTFGTVSDATGGNARYLPVR